MSYIDFLIQNPLFLAVIAAIALSVIVGNAYINARRKRGATFTISDYKLIGALTMSAMLAILFVPLVMYDKYLTRQNRGADLATAASFNKQRFERAKAADKPEDPCMYASVLERIYYRLNHTVEEKKWQKIADAECAGAGALAAAITKVETRYSNAKSAGKNQMEKCVTADVLARLHNRAGSAEPVARWKNTADEECAKVDV